jgi:hypothetical protein
MLGNAKSRFGRAKPTDLTMRRRCNTTIPLNVQDGMIFAHPEIQRLVRFTPGVTEFEIVFLLY